MTAAGKPVTVTDLNTLLATIRNAGVGRDALLVTIAGEDGSDPVSVRIETDRLFTPAPRVDGARPERMAPVVTLGRRETDPAAVDGTAVYGAGLRPLPPVMDAPGPLAGLPEMRRASNDLCRGTWAGA